MREGMNGFWLSFFSHCSDLRILHSSFFILRSSFFFLLSSFFFLLSSHNLLLFRSSFFSSASSFLFLLYLLPFRFLSLLVHPIPSSSFFLSSFFPLYFFLVPPLLFLPVPATTCRLPLSVSCSTFYTLHICQQKKKSIDTMAQNADNDMDPPPSALARRTAIVALFSSRSPSVPSSGKIA